LNCYAETTAASSRLQQFDRYQKIITNGKFNGEIFFHQETLDKIVRQLNPQSMFMCSMCDLFYEGRPFTDIDNICAVMELCPHLTFQVLTKRAERMFEYYTSDRDTRSEGINDGIEHYTGGHLAGDDMVEDFCKRKGITRKFRDRLNHNENIWVNRHWHKPLWPAPNVHLGVTTENQKMLNLRVPFLLQTPAARRFISVEPMLGPVEPNETSEGQIIGSCDECGRTGSNPECECCMGIPSLDWVIIGAESGGSARYCNPHWMIDLVTQCKAAGVPAFVKQIHVGNEKSFRLIKHDIASGKPWPAAWPAELRIQETIK
jgi:protein gp37